MPHLDDGLLHELVDGEVPSDRLGPIQGHLAKCATCRVRLAAVRELTAMTDGLVESLDAADDAGAPVVPLPVRRAAPRWHRGIGIAALLVIAAGVGYGARDLIPPPASPARDAAVAAPATTSDQLRAENAPTLEAPPVPSARPSADPTPAPVSVATPEPATRAEADRAASPTGGEDAMRAAEGARPAAASAAAPLREEFASGATPRLTGKGRTVPLADGYLATSAQRERPAVPLANIAPSASAKMQVVPATIDFADAIAHLGGRLRLVEGLVPTRLERIGDEIRVIYPQATGELILSQRPAGDSITWTLTAPEGFPAESLATLRRMVKD